MTLVVKTMLFDQLNIPNSEFRVKTIRPTSEGNCNATEHDWLDYGRMLDNTGSMKVSP